VEVNCPQCGKENWLENQSRCFACNAILRRCTDCVSYDSGQERCRTTGADVDKHEAANPSLLSVSTNCLTYRGAGAG